MRSSAAGREQTTILCEGGLVLQKQRRDETTELWLGGVDGRIGGGVGTRTSCTVSEVANGVGASTAVVGINMERDTIRVGHTNVLSDEKRRR